MVYPIYVIGHEVLRKEGEDLPIEKSEEISKLIADMFETMKESDGVGLAAPQIGKSLKLFVIDASPLADEEEPELADFKRVFINAKIVEYSGEKVKLNEGCLSLPNLREDVIRHDVLRVQYYDENFVFHDDVISGMPARIMQHEYDHTYGIVFTDRLPKIKQAVLQNKLKAVADGHFKVDYKTVLGNKKTRYQFLVRNLNVNV